MDRVKYVINGIKVISILIGNIWSVQLSFGYSVLSFSNIFRQNSNERHQLYFSFGGVCLLWVKNILSVNVTLSVSIGVFSSVSSPYLTKYWLSLSTRDDLYEHHM